jgi:hypothetical protein
MGLLDHMADLCLVFKEALILFFRVTALACIPTMYKVFFFPTSSPTPVVGGKTQDLFLSKYFL